MNNFPKLAILTESIRWDNQVPLRHFLRLQVSHFYENAPYNDINPEELTGAIKYNDFADLQEKLIKFRPNIIQGPEPYASRSSLKLSIFARKMSKKLEIPLIFPMYENRPAESRFGPVLGLVMKKILSWYAKQATKIFPVNDGAIANLAAAGVAEKKLHKFLWGVWGIETEIFRPAPKSILHVTNPIILFVGRLDPEKGIKYFLSAYKMVKSQIPNCKLQIIGKGKMEGQIRGGGIERLAWRKVRELPKYFQKATLVVYPSITTKRWAEQVGMVNLQSMACGTPVVSTRSGAIPEYVPDGIGGLLVPEKDSKALAEAIIKILEDESLRQKLSEGGRKYILENFDAAKNIQKAEEIVLEILNNQRKPAKI